MKETLSLAQGRTLFQQTVTFFQQLFQSCPITDTNRTARATVSLWGSDAMTRAWSSEEERELTDH